MAKDYLTIGPCPPDESCEGAGGDVAKMRRECNVYRNLLRRVCGREPEGASIVVKSFPHDFGTYMEVCVLYDEDNIEALDYALKLESEGPLKWDDEALDELNPDRLTESIYSKCQL